MHRNIRKLSIIKNYNKVPLIRGFKLRKKLREFKYIDQYKNYLLGKMKNSGSEYSRYQKNIINTLMVQIQLLSIITDNNSIETGSLSPIYKCRDRLRKSKPDLNIYRNK